MKWNRKTTVLCAFVAGTALFATTALADLAIGSGYDNLKQAVKTSFAYYAQENLNLTADVVVEAYYDDTLLLSLQEYTKYDGPNLQRENRSEEKLPGGDTRHYYSYRDPEKSVHQYDAGERYRVYENQTADNAPLLLMDDVFAEEPETMADIERIVDAFVGTLQDLVQMEAEGDGTLYTGQLAESQVPALANALSSVLIKYSLLTDYTMESLGLAGQGMTKDILINDAYGRALTNADGVITALEGRFSIVGQDADGAPHTLTCSLTADITDLGTTTVEAPYLTEENTEFIENTASISYNVMAEKYMGTYTAPLVEETDEAFVKTGEATLTLTGFRGNETIEGHFSVTGENGWDFDFVAENENNGPGLFNYHTVITGADGTAKTVQLSFIWSSTVLDTVEIRIDDGIFYEVYRTID